MKFEPVISPHGPVAPYVACTGLLVSDEKPMCYRCSASRPSTSIRYSMKFGNQALLLDPREANGRFMIETSITQPTALIRRC